MSRIKEILSDAAYESVRSTVPDIREKLVEEAWFERSLSGGTQGPSTSLSEQPGIEADGSLYEGVWGDSVTAEDVYGASSFEYGHEDELPEIPDSSEAYEYDDYASLDYGEEV